MADEGTRQGTWTGPHTRDLDLDWLCDTLNANGTFADNMRQLLGDITTRMSDLPPAHPNYPTQQEIFLRNQLVEAGALDLGETPEVVLERTIPSKRMRLRIVPSALPYDSYARMARIESAIAALDQAQRCMEGHEYASSSDLYEFRQMFQLVFNGQLPEPGSGGVRGEWNTRERMAAILEWLQLPLRAQTTFRVSTDSGWMGIEVTLPPTDAMPTRWYHFQDDEIRSGDAHERAHLAHELYARTCILVAQAAFTSSPSIQHVCVAGIAITRDGHECLLSAKIDRANLCALDVAHLIRPFQAWRCLGGTLELDHGLLKPIRQTFRLEDARFCPPSRARSIELSQESLDDKSARKLGVSNVSDLGVYEEAARAVAAAELSLDWGDSYAHNVRPLLDMAEAHERADVRDAALRCARGLADGSLDNDLEHFRDEFTHGDRLSQAVREASSLLVTGSRGKMRKILEDAIDEAELSGLCIDGPDNVWRFFNSYTERVLYNRLLNHNGAHVSLVPKGYIDALKMLFIHRGEGFDRSYDLARRGADLCPYDLFYRHMLRDLYMSVGDTDGAIRMTNEMLTRSYATMQAGSTYALRAELAYHAEKDNELASACMFYWQRFCPTFEQRLLEELTQNGIAPADDPAPILEARGVPIAPSQKTVDILAECARATVDSGLFDAASQITKTLGSLTRNDIVFGVARSIEAVPTNLHR